ncbi:MAG: PEP-CTERM sorting domain-containing protein [Sedimentisphaerales bacterium]|nr:PEP-CTERM sorting domain-containing protein [Sedimentisphaerales bacterium]MBN2841671.1 PEP-CTERM sorting domain-containing protein [Sedimentisphaerales bacterium]
MKFAGLLLVLLAAAATQAAVIDDFSDGDLSDYTNTVILNNGTAALNASVWQVNNGSLEIVTSVYDDVEQSAFIKNGYTLNIGQELRVDISHNGGSQDIGLYVGVEPTEGTRKSYVSVYSRVSQDAVYSRGFNGTSEMNLKSGAYAGGDCTLFISRDGANDYEAGFYNGTERVVIADRNGLVFGAGDSLVVGLYTDIRAAGTLGSFDNLAIVPEPATLALLGLGGLVAARKRK